MKLFSAIFLVGIAASFVCGFNYDDLPAIVQDAMTVCKSEMSITDQEMQQMMSANDSHLGCVRACILKKLGAMDNTGILDTTKLESLAKEIKDHDMTDELAVRLALHCAEDVKPEMDECAAASAFTNCVTDKDRAI